MRHKNIYVLALMLLLSGSLMAQVRIGGSVYGGCELGKVTKNTEVYYNGGTTIGSVYGGGQGSATDLQDGEGNVLVPAEQTGWVKGNATVIMTGGLVERSVYGGGELGSVGTFLTFYGAGESLHIEGEPETCQTGTGVAKVVISGNSQVGVIDQAIMPPPDPDQDDYGYIFCGSRGIADSIRYPKANKLAIVDSTYLEIGGNALVTASAYGGCENGQVLRNTYVLITDSCQIGVGHYRVGSTHHFDPKYTAAQWNGRNPANFHEVSHWPFRSPFNIYDAYANQDGYYDDGNTVSARGGSHQPSNGHTFYGNVFGGGSGYYAIEPDPSGTPAVPYHTWRRSAGRVNGNTRVDFESGHILNNLYGGNEMTDVIGSCTVNMSGGTLGVPRTLDSIRAHPVSCYLFGAGKGDPRTFFNKMTNVGSVTVNVTGGRIFGSVFGGGEDGHVMGDVEVNINLPSDNDTIGTLGTSYVDGNVFGGGRGFDGIAQTAGNVGGNIEVNITHGTMLGSVYGGGRLGSVGTDLLFPNETNYGVMSSDPNRGNITVTITGGIVGNDDPADYTLSHSRGGHVFGGSMGRLTRLDGTLALTDWHKLGAAKSTTVDISGTAHIKGNVYGGSELGTVTENITVNISADAVIGRNAAGSTSHGNVYGGGVGHPELTAAEKTQVNNAATSDSIPTFAGLTGGTIQVNITGGSINNNVYGAGELASVGTIASVTKHEDPNTSYYLSWPYEYTYSGTSGDARVNITGGTIGFISGSDTTGGNIYGSARGTVGDRYVTARLATARVTHVDINLTNPADKIIGDVYGSGENGHVYDSAVVTLRNGLVLGSVYGGGKGTDKYATQLKNTSTDALYDADVYDIVAGKVFGNTYVNILGGRVEKNVYGGGNLAAVGIGNYKGYGEGSNVSQADSLLAENTGHCHVTILGGIVGPDTLVNGTAYNEAYAVTTGNVYGAGKGIVFPVAPKEGYDYGRDYFMACVNKTTVVFGDSTQRSCAASILYPQATGEIFGGGENGRVRFDTYVQTNRGQIGVRPTANDNNLTSDMGHWKDRGNVFGAGRGEDKNTDGTYCQSAGHVGRNTTIDILGARIFRNVQGGGSMAAVGPFKGYTGDSSTCVINVRLPQVGDTLGGPRNTHNAFGGYVGGGSRGIPSPDGHDSSMFATCHNSQINFYQGYLKNTIYGGGENGQMLGNTELNIYGGYIRSAVYAGGKGSWMAPASEQYILGNYDDDTLSGYVYGNTLINALGGQLPFLYGGCRRASVGGNATINIGKDEGGTYVGEASFIPGKDKVYGGNQYAGSPRGNIYVNVYKTAYTPANEVSGTDYAINYVYGGSYNSPYLPTDSGHYAQVHIYGCENTIDTVYGGCAAANVGAKPGIGASTKLIIDGGRFNAVFGGGDGTFDRYLGDAVPANIYGAAVTEIHGGTIGSLFGGSNFKGAADTVRITVDNEGPCGDTVTGDEFFGGSNVADLGPTELSTTLGCGVKFRAAYGGSNQADIVGNVSLTIKGGEFEEVYAGSKGAIVAPSASDGMKDTVCADIDGNTHLTIQGGKIHNAFGGSNINGNITGTITVDIDSTYNTCDYQVVNVYGGSNYTQYLPDDSTVTNHSPSPLVNLLCGTVDTNVYGGGKGDSTDYHAGLVRSNPKVYMTQTSKGNTWVKGNIYGGGEMATVGQFTSNPSDSVTTSVATRGNTYVLITGGTVGPANVDVTDINSLGNVYGGGLGKAGTNQAGTISYSHFNYVNTTRVEVSGTAHVRGSVFGGGENGHVFDSTKVAISGGTIGVRIPLNVRSYDPESVEGVENSHVYTGNVYGGGRGVDHSGSHLSLTAGRVYGNTHVTISDSAHIYHAVYGGGSFASVGTFTRTPDATLFGGVEHTFAANTGRTIVTLTGGRVGPKWRDLLYDTRGHYLMNNSETAILTNAEYKELLGSDTPVSTADTIAKNFAALGENEGMVYGSGRGMNYDNSNNPDHRMYAELAFANNTFVTVSDTADIVGSVFGGGENGHVKGDTRVVVSGGKIGGFRLHHNGFFLPLLDAAFNPDMTPRSTIRIEDSNEEDDELDEGVYGTGRRIFRGNVYGGGRGADHTPGNPENSSSNIYSASAGRVYGNTNVHITGNARVLHNVFGGGSVASVGTYVYGGANGFYGDPTDIHAGTGVATVVIDGGRIGITGENEGGVYGGGRGIAASTTSNATHLAYVDSTFVHITDGVSASKPTQFADVRGSVFGGGMNGHVLHNTSVKVSGGVVGGKMAFDYGHYDTISFPSTLRPATVDTTIYGVNFYSGARHQDTLSDRNGRVDNGISVFLGNVYGGGRGVDHYTDSGTPHLSNTAGRVYGNAHVLITGGLIYHNVYGGGSVASVGRYNTSGSGDVTWVSGGKATVDIRGGRLGTAGRNDGRVFGSSRGMAGGEYVNTSYVNIAHVTIGKADASAAPDVRGTVFGGGENGHVLDSTLVTINKGSIGRIRHTGEVAWVDDYVGNVYGAGRGVDLDIVDHHASRSAGWVKNSTHVIINGGNIYGNIYGGASLGFVGDTSTTGYTATPVALSTTAQSGRTWIDVFGGHVYGSVFGAGRGRAGKGHLYGNDYTHHTWSANAVVRVNYTAAASATNRIDGSVYGGGLNGHVSNSTYVTLTKGEVGGDVYGGGSGEDTYFAFLRDASGNYLNASGNIVCDGSTTLETIREGLAADGENIYKTIAIVDSLSSTAGSVRGNSTVLIDGAGVHVVGNVFGGGALSHLGTDGNNATGTATVEVTNGTIDGSLYGAGKGRGEDDFKEFCDVRTTSVAISGGQVKGDVYGGGQNGHTLEGTTVAISGNTTTIGDATVDATALAGNVFGGGQGSGDMVDHDNNNATPNEFRIYKHAGRVGGNTTVTMTDGYLIGSIFGGGRLAMTGVDANGDFDPTADVTQHGNATVTVSGGTIGVADADTLLRCDWSVGDVMGSGKGDIDNYEDVWAGRVTNATVSVTGNPVIRGSVFGGGEMASVGWWNNAGVFYPGTGETSVTIGSGSDNPVIGLAEEFGYTSTDNPGEWTIYDRDGKIVHTITGNVVGGSQGDIDIAKPHWVSMAHSRTATVTVNSGTVRSTVYGGSEQGMVKGDTRVTINGGTFGTNVTTGSGASTHYVVGGIYAAGYGSDDKTDDLSAASNDSTDNRNNINSQLQGVSAHLATNTLALAGRTFGDAHVDILGGHILGSVFGGGENASVGYELSSNKGHTYVNIGNPSGGSAIIDGDVFGANNLQGTPYGNTNVNIYHTAHSGTNRYPNIDSLKALAAPTDSLTGLDLRAQYAEPSSMPQTFALHAVYGGGNRAAHTPYAEEGVANVHVWYCDENTINEVYGGGNAADTKNNHLIIDGGRIHRVFGGGNGYSASGNHSNSMLPDFNPGANVNGIAKTEIKGGLIDSVWGGSNQLGFILNTLLQVTLEDPNCPEIIDVTTAGGNEAPSNGGTVTVSCGAYQENFYAGGSFSDVGTPDNPTSITLNVEGGHITNLYAGCQGDRASYGGNHTDRAANVYGDITLNFYGGNVTNLFGGSHRNGNITGTITVNVDIDPDYNCPDGLRLEYVYGAGQDASYTPTDPFRASPIVNIMNNRYKESGASDSSWVQIKDVFGGGLGVTAVSTSYPRVVVGGFGPKIDSTNTGTPQAPVWQTSQRYTRGARVFGNVYGGGSAAPVVGNTTVVVRDAVIGRDTPDPTHSSGLVFGGGLGATAKVSGETYIGIFGKSDIKNNVYGGGNAGIVTGNTELQIAYQKQIFPVDIIAYRYDESTIKGGFHCTTQKELPAGKSLRYRYTTDGTAPTPTTGTLYIGDVLADGHNPSYDFVFDWGQKVQAIAYLWDDVNDRLDTSMMPSVVSFDLATAPAMTFKAGATHDTILLNGTIGARLRYTLDGSTPTTSDTLYGTVGEDAVAPRPIVLEHGSTAVVKAMAEMRGCFDSHVSTLSVDPPTITISGTTVTITGPEGSTLYYTVDGTTPVANVVGSTPHGSTADTPVSFTVPDPSQDCTIKAIAHKTGHTPSLIGAAVYRANP